MDDEAAHLLQVADRLADEFGQDRSRVQEQVRAAADLWTDAKVRTFVPVMVERRVRKELQHDPRERQPSGSGVRANA